MTTISRFNADCAGSHGSLVMSHGFIALIAFLVLVLTACSRQPQDIHVDPPVPVDGLRSVVLSSPHRILFYLNGEFIGDHHFHRGNKEFVAEMNDQFSWLVVQEGLPGDSYPTVFAYQVAGGKLVKSKQMESIKEYHYRSKPEGPIEPVFLGFDSDGIPKVHSVTGGTVLKE